MPGNLGGFGTAVNGQWRTPSLKCDAPNNGTVAPAATINLRVGRSLSLFRPSNGQFFTTVASAAGYSRSNDIGLAGPIVNGRDQAAAFGATDTLHLYFIWNGTTLGTISSLVSPAAGGPVLPTSYTHWAHAGVYLLSGGNFVPCSTRGEVTLFADRVALVANGTAVVETAFAITTQAPVMGEEVGWGPMQYLLAIEGEILCTAGGNAQSTLRVRTPDSGNGSVIFTTDIRVSASASGRSINTQNVMMPQSSQVFAGAKFGYLFTDEVNAGNISARRANIWLLGYTNPFYAG